MTNKPIILSGTQEIDVPSSSFNGGNSGTWLPTSSGILNIGGVEFTYRNGLPQWRTLFMGQTTIKFPMPFATTNNYGLSMSVSGVANGYRMNLAVIQYYPDRVDVAYVINAFQPNQFTGGDQGTTPFRPVYKPLIHWIAIDPNGSPYIQLINPQKTPQTTIDLGGWFISGGTYSATPDNTVRVNFYSNQNITLSTAFPDASYAVFGSLNFAQHGYGLMLNASAAGDYTNNTFPLSVVGMDNWMVNVNGNTVNTDWPGNGAISTIIYCDKALKDAGNAGSFDIVFSGFAIHPSINSVLGKYIQLFTDTVPSNMGNRMFAWQPPDNPIAATNLAGSASRFMFGPQEITPSTNTDSGNQTVANYYAPSTSQNVNSNNPRVANMYSIPSGMVSPVAINAYIKGNYGGNNENLRSYLLTTHDNQFYRVYYFMTGANTQGSASMTAKANGTSIQVYALIVSNLAWLAN